MSSSANVNCFDLSNMIDELCRRYAQFCLMFTLLIPTDTHFLKLLMLEKVNLIIRTLKIYIQICRHNKGFHHPILDSLKSCFRLVTLISVVCNIKRTIQLNLHVQLFLLSDHLPHATTYPKHQIILVKSLQFKPFVNDHLS